MSKWLAAAQAIAQKSGGGASAESARSQPDTKKGGQSGLYALYAPPTLASSRVTPPSVVAAVHAGQVSDQTLQSGEFAELLVLVNLIADHNAFTPEQRAEAQDIAQADAVAALECFRSLAERDGLITVH